MKPIIQELNDDIHALRVKRRQIGVKAFLDKYTDYIDGRILKLAKMPQSQKTCVLKEAFWGLLGIKDFASLNDMAKDYMEYYKGTNIYKTVNDKEFRL